MAGEINWREINERILASLDIQAVYEELGIRFAGQPGTNGWHPCHARGREDRNPSAQVNLQTGRYRDFGDSVGKSVSLWDFAASSHGGDWQTARAHYAQQVGVELPDVRQVYRRDELKFGRITPGMLSLFCGRKRGVTPAAIVQCGARYARWYDQYLMCFAGWGPRLFDDDENGWHCAGAWGQLVRRGRDNWGGTIQLGSPGLLNDWAVRHWSTANTVWVVEGLSDMLTMQVQLGEDTTEVVTAMGGCSVYPSDELAKLFSGKAVNICFDSDPPEPKFDRGRGFAGAAQWVVRLSKIAEHIRNVTL